MKHQAPQFELPVIGAEFNLYGERAETAEETAKRHEAEQFELLPKQPKPVEEVGFNWGGQAT